MTDKHAKQLRAMIEKSSASLSDEDALTAIELFPEWKTDTAYTATERVHYDGKLYRCEQAHTSQEGWEPPNVPALFTEVSIEDIPVWRQPTGAQDAYMTGDKVWYPAKDTTVYVSTVDNNVWEPTVYGWAEERKGLI